MALHVLAFRNRVANRGDFPAKGIEEEDEVDEVHGLGLL